MPTPTAIPPPLDAVVVVGGPPSLVEATREATRVVAADAYLELAELGEAINVVVRCRPFAIVMNEDIYTFDSVEFDALARDVNATLIRVDATDVDAAKLERELMPKLGQAHRRR
jgi:hypothetical protein